ncbi:hypothetical protein Tco_1134768 [Tanacetum coccineum]
MWGEVRGEPRDAVLRGRRAPWGTSREGMARNGFEWREWGGSSAVRAWAHGAGVEAVVQGQTLRKILFLRTTLLTGLN